MVVVGTVDVVLEVEMLGVGGSGGGEEQKGEEEGQVERRSRHGCSALLRAREKAAAAESLKRRVVEWGLYRQRPGQSTERRAPLATVPCLYVQTGSGFALGQQVDQCEGRKCPSAPR